MSKHAEGTFCDSCQELINTGDRCVEQGNGDTHHAECFEEFADEQYRYTYNDYAYYTLGEE